MDTALSGLPEPLLLVSATLVGGVFPLLPHLLCCGPLSFPMCLRFPAPSVPRPVPRFCWSLLCRIRLVMRSPSILILLNHPRRAWTSLVQRSFRPTLLPLFPPPPTLAWCAHSSSCYISSSVLISHTCLALLQLFNVHQPVSIVAGQFLSCRARLSWKHALLSSSHSWIDILISTPACL